MSPRWEPELRFHVAVGIEHERMKMLIERLQAMTAAEIQERAEQSRQQTAAEIAARLRAERRERAERAAERHRL